MTIEDEMRRLLALSSRLDERGHHDISDRMDRVAMAFHATPSPDRLVEEGCEQLP